MNSGTEVVKIFWIIFCHKQLSNMEHNSLKCRLALFWVLQKTPLTVNYGIFGAFLKVLSLKEHLICNSVHIFTFLRDWSHDGVAFCAGCHKPV